MKKSELEATLAAYKQENKELKERIARMERKICTMTGDDR